MSRQHHLTAITGGIGAGKSIVSRVLTAMGYPVYDCDSRARSLMDMSAEIKHAIALNIGAGVILPDDSIDRRLLAEIVFRNKQMLLTLNSIVHQAVRDDLARWVSDRSSALVFVETAILYESGLDRVIDSEWHVTAPTDIRVNRVIARNRLSREHVLARIEAQSGTTPPKSSHNIITLVNDDITPLLPQIEKALFETVLN